MNNKSAFWQLAKYLGGICLIIDGLSKFERLCLDNRLSSKGYRVVDKDNNLIDITKL